MQLFQQGPLYASLVYTSLTIILQLNLAEIIRTLSIIYILQKRMYVV